MDWIRAITNFRKNYLVKIIIKSLSFPMYRLVNWKEGRKVGSALRTKGMEECTIEKRRMGG